MTHILILILAALMIAATKTKSYAKKVYSSATIKATEMSKKESKTGGEND